MRALDDVGLAFLLAGALALGLIVRRLALRNRGAVLDLCVRSRGNEGHWVLGLARYAGDRVQWYRIFALSARPSRTFNRCDVQVVGRRQPSHHEAVNFVHGAIVLECLHDGQRLDLCLPQTALTGFLAWLEAMPPGSAAGSHLRADLTNP